MRIAIVVPSWFKVPPDGYGGIEVLVSLLADGFTDKGHEVTLFTIADSVTKANKFAFFDKEMKSYLDATTSGFLNIALTHSLASYLEISRGKYDIIHDNTWKEGLCSAAFMDIPVVHTLHGPFDDENKGFYSLFKNFSGIHFVSISDHQRACFPDLNYIATVYNGIDFPKYPFSEEKDDFFFYIGRFNAEKAPHLACEVAEKLGEKLVLAGKVHEEVERSYFEQHIKPHLSDKITFIGEVGQWSKEKMTLFSRGKAYLYPIQWDEPFGITMAEALACGTPVVTFKKGSPAEVVAHNETGFVVETMDEFVDAVGRINEISPRKCRERAEKMFTARTMVDNYERVFEEVLGSK